ncbi:hypothetical protein PUN28_009272 [Cardiocondyla obscurior]|uniref:Uncharacterized protein n=1 Tax=Cardiocondyla obscurior TaxID=286306 RepID=A0AAW2FTD1_9HYME
MQIAEQLIAGERDRQSDLSPVKKSRCRAIYRKMNLYLTARRTRNRCKLCLSTPPTGMTIADGLSRKRAETGKQRRGARSSARSSKSEARELCRFDE